MAPFGLTVIAALTLWSIVHLLLNAFVGDQPNFPNENPLEFVVNSTLLLIVGWMMTGVAYAIGRFKMNQSTAFATCISTMAVFAYLVAVSTHNKILRSVKPLEKKVDRIMICKTYPQAAASGPCSVEATLDAAERERLLRSLIREQSNFCAKRRFLPEPGTAHHCA